MVKIKVFTFFIAVMVGVFLGFSNKIFASEAPSSPHNGHVCTRDGVKDCEWAFSPSGQYSTYQVWGTQTDFKYKRYGGTDGETQQDVCISRDNQMWNQDDDCWLQKKATTLLEAWSYANDIDRYISDGKIYDLGYVVLHVRVDHAETESNFTVESRQVSNNSLTASPATPVLNQGFVLNWSTEWATLGAYIEQFAGGGGFFDSLFGVNSQKTKSGTTASLIPTTAGDKKFRLCASGPGIQSGTPDGPGGSDSGPPFEVYLPGQISFAAAGDGMTTDPCKELTVAIDNGATLRTTPVADNDNGTAEFSFNAVQGGSSPANQTVTIRNNTMQADRDLSWKADISYTSGNGWLSLQSTQGNVAAGNSVDKNVSVDVSGLSAGTYKAKITITGCSNGTSGTGGGCSANTITNGQYAQADDYNPLTLNVTFVVSNSGTVNVTSNKATTFGFGGGGSFSGCPSMTIPTDGGTWTCNTVQPGTHTINPANLSGSGYSDPPAVSPSDEQTLSAGGTKTYAITYTAATGTISVTSNKRTDWNINGPGSSDFSATNDDFQNYNGVPLGDYTISGVPATLIADSGRWWTLDSITPSTTQTLSSSGQTKTFTIDYDQTQPVCSPGTQSVLAGSSASFTATGGDTVFSWSAPGGSTESGTGSSFSTTYSTTSPPDKTVTVTSNQGQTDTCSVTVTAGSACTADIKADGGDGPVSIDYGTASNLSWTTINATSCSVAPGGWTGTSNPGQSTGSLTSSQTYTLSCTGLGDPCSNAVTVNVNPLPTLSVGLTANPSTDFAPLSSVLSASVGGTAVGTINYSFWWNCSDTSNSVATVEAACGTLPTPAGGSCLSNSVGYKCNGVNTNPQSTTAHTYNSSSTGKVIAERDIATPAEARAAITIIALPPSASGVTATQPNYCVSGPAATVGWTYTDPIGSPQSAYRVQIDNNSSFVSPEVDSAKTISTSTSYFGGSGILQFNTNYYVRVMVWNSSDTASSWSSTVGFSTPNYAYPQVDFSFTPTNPPISEPVQFTDATTFYAPGPTTWSWLFGDTGTSTLQNPSHTYTTEGSYGATLTATDNAGQSCNLTKPVNIQKAIPVWKEVAPR